MKLFAVVPSYGPGDGDGPPDAIFSTMELAKAYVAKQNDYLTRSIWDYELDAPEART